MATAESQAADLSIRYFRPPAHLECYFQTIFLLETFVPEGETIADLVQRAGFPQLLLQPINFDALYLEHQQRLKAENGGKADGHGIIVPPTIN